PDTGYTVGSPDTVTIFIVSEDDVAPDGYTVTINEDMINLTNEESVGFTISGIPFLSLYEYSISSSGGGTPITGNGGPLLVTTLNFSEDLSSLADGTITLTVILGNILGTKGNPTSAMVL